MASPLVPFIVLLCALSYAAAQGSWTHPTGNPRLHWSINASNWITFTYQANTVGWLAMGLSPDGTMVGSDIFWGQYDSVLGPIIVDRMAFAYQQPPPDASQDVFIIPAQCNTSTNPIQTTLTFTRKLVTGDVNDRAIVAGQMNLVWSYSAAAATRPASAGADWGFIQHNFQGSASVDFLTPTQTTTAAIASTSNAVTTAAASTNAATTGAASTSNAASTGAASTSVASTTQATTFASTTSTSATAQAASLAAVTDTTSFTSLAATTTQSATSFGASTSAASTSAAASTRAASTNAASTSVASTFAVITTSAGSTASVTTAALSTSLAAASAATTAAAATVAATTGTRPVTVPPGPPGTAPTSGSGSFTSPDGVITLAWQITGTVIRFTMSSQRSGWFACGLSRSGGMLNADVFWAQVNAGVNGSAVVLDRYTTTKSLPPMDPTQNTRLISGGRTAGVSTVVFERPLTTGDTHDVPITDVDQTVIWAWANSLGTPVAKRQGGAVVDYAFDEHQSKGALLVNFATGAATSVGRVDTLRKLHGIIMLVAWGLLSVVGTFIARYNKASMGKWWFYLHVSFQLFCIVLNFIGFLMIVIYRMKEKDSHFDGPHPVIGLVVLIFSIVQPVMGLISHLLFDPARNGAPFFPDKVHWLIGGFILFLTLIELWLGLSIYCVSVAAVVCFGLYIFVTTAMFLSFDLMRWLAPWGEYLRGHEKTIDAPKRILVIVQVIGILIVLIAMTIVCWQVWAKKADENTLSFYAACEIGELSGGLHWAYYLGFGGAFVLGCATVSAVAWCITTGLDRKYKSQGDNPYVISL